MSVDAQLVESSPTVEAPSPVQPAEGAESRYESDMRQFLDTGEMPKPAEAEPEKEQEAKATEAEPEQPIERTEEPEKQPESGTGSKPKGAEHRKAQLARDIQNALQERAKVLQELQFLEERKRAAMDQPKPAAKPSEPDSPKEPKLADFDDYEAYQEAREAYLVDKATREALAKFEAKQQREAEARAEQQREAEAREAAQAWTDRVNAMPADYHDVVTSNDELGRALTVEVAQAIMATGNPAIAYHLGKNVAEAAKLKALPTAKMLIEIGKLDARLSLEAKAPDEKAKPKPVVKPVPRELGVGSAPVDEMAAALERGDFATYERLMDARERKR